MIDLPNNCRRGKLNVHPSNWKTSKAKLTDDWYVECRFIDPKYIHVFPKGKIDRARCGINKLETVALKRAAMKFLCKKIETDYEDGHNPITCQLPERMESLSDPKFILTEVSEKSLFIPALRFALSKSSVVTESAADISSALKYLESAAETLDFEIIPIGEIQVKHIKLCLDECYRANPRFSAKRFNKVKAYLSGLFKYLIQVGATTGNMALAVSPMKEDATKPVVMKDAEIKKIKEHLWRNNRPFYKFMMMFYYSGGRIKEFMRLQGKDVDLVEQTYTTLVKKGKQRWVSRTIRNVALPYWKEQMKDCGPEDYVFSVDLLPGVKPINSKQVSRRWMTHVKEPLGIAATFYKLKHVNSDRTLEALGAKMAAGQNAHTSTKMVEQVYAHNEKKRIHEGLKGLDIEL